MPRARAQKFSRNVKLVSGGIITLTGTADPLQLTGADRDFVFKLVDHMAAYEQAHKGEGNGAPAGSAS